MIGCDGDVTGDLPAKWEREGLRIHGMALSSPCIVQVLIEKIDFPLL